MDPNGKGIKVLESMTIHKQYLEYNELKALMHHKIKMVNRWSLLLNIIGLVSFIYLIITLILDKEAVPMSCFIGHALIFSGDFSVVKP